MWYNTGMSFKPVPNFTEESYQTLCPVTASQKVTDVLSEEFDDFIFRGPMLYDAVQDRDIPIGFFDIRKAAIVDAAVEYLGMLPEDESAVLRDDLSAAELNASTYRSLLQEERFISERLREEVLDLLAEITSIYLENGLENPDATADLPEVPYPEVQELLTEHQAGE